MALSIFETLASGERFVLINTHPAPQSQKPYAEHMKAIMEIESAEMEKYKDPDSAEHKAMVEYIRKELNLSSLKYQRLEKLLSAIGLDEERVCTYCWTGKDIEA